MRRSLMIVIPLAGLGLFALGWAHSGNQEPAEEASPARAVGIVFHDANGNRDFDDGEKPLAGIRVSNGREIVKTDENGRYELPVDDDTVLFVIKPRGWRTPISSHQLPRFYYVHKPQGSPDSKFAGVRPTGPLPKSVDFPLYPQEEPEEFKRSALRRPPAAGSEGSRLHRSRRSGRADRDRCFLRRDLGRHRVR
jgi:hypothetical protein